MKQITETFFNTFCILNILFDHLVSSYLSIFFPQNHQRKKYDISFRSASISPLPLPIRIINTLT